MGFQFKFFSRLAFKVPLMMGIGAVVAGISVAAGAFVLSRNAALEELETSLTSTVDSRAQVVNRFWTQAQTNVRLLSEMPTVISALDSLSADIRMKGDDAEAQLQKLYIDDNPVKGDRSRYNGESDQTSYGFYHEQVHKILNQARILFDFDDLLVVNNDGVVVYSSAKARDFASNVKTGPLKDSPLGKVVKGALDKAKTNEVAFVDFGPYAANEGKVAGFMARVVKDDKGAVIGVVAVRVGSTALSASVYQSVGREGRFYLLGPDRIMRTDAEAGVETAGTRSFAPAFAAEILPTRTATGQDVGTTGKTSLMVARGMNVMGNRWVAIAEVSLSEIEEPIIAMGLKLLGLAGAVIAIVFLFGILAARRIYRPIVELKDAVGQMATGEKAELRSLNRKDEIGDLTRAMSAIYEAGVASARIRAALDSSPALVLVTDPDDKIVYVSRAALGFFREIEPALRRSQPDFSADDMIGQPVDYFRANPAIERKIAATTGALTTGQYLVEGRTVLFSAATITAADGSPIGQSAIYTEVTAELQAQQEIAAVVRGASAGDFSRRVPVENKSGALLDMSEGLNHLADTVQNALADFASAMEAVAEGDLTTGIEAAYDGMFGELKDALNRTVERLSETVSTIKTTAEDVNSAAREISSGAADLSGRTEQQASSLEETAATTEQLAASVKTSAQASRQAVELAEQAMGVATHGGDIVRDAVDAMARIEQASQKISDITGVIDEIAFQTNLLALNAAVEAARAGDAGKGFAVVASEVRTLAQRSSAAAKDITGLISASGSEVAQGVKLVRGAGEALEKIVSASQKVSATVSDISSASGEQANGIDEMSQAVAHMDEMTQQNAAMAEESAASAAALTDQIEKLNELVAMFRTRGDQGAGRRAGRIHADASAPSEPERLRRLAADAFSEGGRAVMDEPAHRGRPARRKVAGASGAGWEEF
jgi:methyl-accepting chemotaxis protein